MLKIDSGKLRSSENARRAEISGVTLVAYYGPEKPQHLRHLLDEMSSYVEAHLASLPGLFERYPVAQIHATITGLEGRRNTHEEIIGDNVRERVRRFGGVETPMDIDGLLAFLRRHPWPIEFQLGGFAPNDQNPYDPDTTPWTRGFDIQTNGLLVVMGWSGLGPTRPFAPILLGIRKFAERFGVIHKYHIDPVAQDNDLFLVLGALRADVWEALMQDERHAKAAMAVLSDVRQKIRSSLAARPVFIEMSAADLSVAKYHSATLTSCAFTSTLCDITAASLRSLYE